LPLLLDYIYDYKLSDSIEDEELDYICSSEDDYELEIDELDLDLDFYSDC